ncbi:flagellar hook protein [Virgibacillus profundi]|uniref:Flagellar hook-associated protein 2 n=2 Tax=Virgibacillus profundi TaxID=2024555 RepID=A0A2A2IIE5_9BACI|nr:flagellar hook-associated protein 2 [Virgibacillus profundi]PAV31076.1 flagellar hook protein [Virgibacillus profundi]PXY55260.1 flagellar hook protein [Virgibacillus profundi]
MRVGGLATGMDIDSIVNKLMTAERIPLDKMQQDKTMLEWKRDAFRDVNKKLSEFDQMILDMKMSSTYNSKTVSSSQEGAVTATGTSSASNGSYNIKVNQLASTAINIGEELSSDLELDKPLKDQLEVPDTIQFTTYNENGGKTHNIKIQDDDTLNDVLSRITSEDNNVRAFYDSQSNRVIMETTKTGNYNENGKEIEFTDDSFFSTVLNMKTSNEKGGTNATFEYNNSGVEMESKTNSYQLNGITFEFKNETDGNAVLTVNNDVESSFESIIKFVDKYNEVVETLNASQREEKYRDYPPLTDEQKKDMSEDEIELWEERAKSGLLRGESALSSGLFSMRQSWYSSVETGGAFNSLTQIGIETSKDYLDGGKLVVNENDLREALRKDPASVQKLFSNSEENDSRGLVNRLEDSLESTINQIGERAGNDTHTTLENYTLGKRMKDLNERISAFEDRLVVRENRYWSQFTAMESAISRMNMQSSQLMSQFGGGM